MKRVLRNQTWNAVLGLVGLMVVAGSGCTTATISIGQINPEALKGMKRLAVLDFAGGGAEGALTGSAVAGMVQTHLSVKRGFEVVEREKFGELLAEHKLLKEGVIDEDTAQEFRKAHGIDGIITGSIIQYSREQRFQFIPLVGPVPYNQTSVAFNLRLIEVQFR